MMSLGRVTGIHAGGRTGRVWMVFDWVPSRTSAPRTPTQQPPKSPLSLTPPSFPGRTIHILVQPRRPRILCHPLMEIEPCSVERVTDDGTCLV